MFSDKPFLVLVVMLLAIIAAIVAIWDIADEIRDYLAPDPHLVIEHEDLVAFTQISNSFSSLMTSTGADPSVPCSGDLENYWSGLLFHLGDYESDCNDYQGVRITLEGGETHDFNRTDFVWINIVARHDGNRVAGCGDFEDCYVPMSTDELDEILPTTSISEADSCCWELTDCKQAAPIHARMRAVPNIMTFWQGSHGYEMNSEYSAHPDGTHNSYGLVFGDEFEVWVYDLAEGSDGSCTVTELDHFVAVEEIRVIGGDGGSGGGVRMDPPMP